MRLASTTLAANAEGTIGDALRSVVDQFDACIVIDTGITDRTLDVARAVAGDKLVVRSLPWTNDVAAARNFALEAALDAGADWAIAVDPDERLLREGMDLRAAFAATTAAVLFVESDTREHATERCVRLPTVTRWRGRTHPMLEARGTIAVGMLPTARIHARPKDSFALRKKLERDIGLLEQEAEQDPRHAHWHYHRGECHRQLQQHDQAIAAYEACIALRGFREQAAWACHQAAVCHIARGEPERAIDACVLGLSRHAGIAELPWLAAVTSHRLGHHAQAVYWARLAIAWGWYRGEGASVPRSVARQLPALYEGPFDVLRFALRAQGDRAGADEAERCYHLARYARLQLGIEQGAEHDLALVTHAFYVGRPDEGLQACERLLARPLSREAFVRCNRTWYTKTLDTLVSTRFVRLDVPPAHTGWSLCNPSIVAREGGWLAIVRSTDHRTDAGEGSPERIAARATESVLVELSPSLAVERARVCTGPTYPRSGFPIAGLEDCRIYPAHDGLSVSGTIRDHAGFDELCRIATARLDTDSATLSELRILDVSDELHERNWMPIPGQERWIYHCGHDRRTTTATPVRTDGRERVQLERLSPAPRIAHRFRGGSQLVPVDHGYLALVHEVAFDGDRRIHEHRFVRFDDDLAITSWSTPFYFRETRSIEFAAGLALAGDRLVASFGVRDAEAWLVELDLHETLALTRCR